MSKWNELSMKEKSEMMKVAVQNGIYSLNDIKQRYNEFAEGGDTNLAMTGMMKSKLATAAQFGNPTARRMTNYDTRSYTWPGEYEYDLGIGEPRRGNVYVGSYDNLVTPQIQDTGNGLTFIDNVWSPENDQRSYMQSLKFNSDADAQYFGEHYKEVAPMMNLYSKGGHKIHIKPENRGKFTRLKERTGHSASWFKAHGTPAQKKMAIFELNARHWKHGMGGNLFDGESQSTQQISQGSWKQRHQSQWYGFLRNKGVSDADAQRLSEFFTAQDGFESAGGTSSAARKKNNYGGMQKGGKNIAYNTVQDYMEDKWKMMNNRFKPALSAKTVDEYATILGNPDTAGKGYLYYVTDSAPYDPNSPEWRAAQTQHMHNYINGMRRYAGMKSINFKDNPALYAQLPDKLPERPVDNTPLFMPSNPEIFFNIEQPAPIVIEEETNPVMDLIRRQQEPSEAEVKRVEQQENLRKFNLMMGLLNPQKESDSLFDTMGLLSAIANKNSYGGHIYDGTTESTQQMNTYYGNKRVEPITGEAGNLGGITIYGKKPKYNYLKEWPGKTHPLTAGDAMKGIDAATGPLLHWMQPSQYVGAVRDAANGKNPLVSMLRGNSGVVSEEYAQEHPWLSTAINIGTDAFVLSGGPQRTVGIANNLRPQNLRNHVYVAKAPIGYDGLGEAVRRGIKGVLSGRKADIDNPFWFNRESAESLQNYAPKVEGLSEAEYANYLKNYGERALRARTDMWRLYNKIPQKYGTFTPSTKHPGAYTDVEGIESLKAIPPQISGENQVDFVNSVGGNIGKPVILDLGRGIPDAGYTGQNFGVTTTSDLWDLHPFSRPADRIIPKYIKPFYTKHVGNPLRKASKALKNMSDRLRFDNKEINDYLAANKEDEFAMEMFDPDMFPSVGLKRKVGDFLYDTSLRINKVANTPEFTFLKPLEQKIADFEVGKLVGSKPVLVQYDIPWTANRKLTIGSDGMPQFTVEYSPGFHSNNIFPDEVMKYKSGTMYPWDASKDRTYNMFTNLIPR